MQACNLDTTTKAEELVSISRKYNNLDVDVIYGRCTVDGRSFLGVISLVGHMVTVEAYGENKKSVTDFYNEVKEKIGV